MKPVNLIQKIVSGGQTGADQGALLAAKKCAIKTGGFAPKGWKTEAGANPSLCLTYNLVECNSDDYAERTEKNVKTTDLTLIFSDRNSKGSLLTKSICDKKGKPYLMLSTLAWNEETDLSVTELLHNVYKEKNRPLFLNIAGNRESVSPGIKNRVAEILERLLNGYKV